MDPIFTSIGSIVALIAGTFLKKNPNFANRFIPIATFAISLLTQIVAATQAEASVFGDITKNFGGILWNALLQALLTTGAHSAGKNVLKG
jgi:uncharacterized membrane protein YfbV (UPF0208 family)